MAERFYKEYFDINPKYYAAVTADLIKQGKVSWKDFYPHETFVKLLETTYKVLSGSANRSIWVEGAYGTGKSHAALTVKSIIDAPDDEVEAYFREFNLSMDLCNKLASVKNSGKKILTIHRIGSASINTDMDLILAVQQSVMAALREKGIANHGEAAMRDAFLEWIKTPANRDYFNSMIRTEKYAWTFGGQTVDSVVRQLQTGTDDEIENLMRNVMTVLKDNGVYGLIKDVNHMADWIKSIIGNNGLSAILFVWDEFSEYFLNHPVGLTGFQTLIEISQSHPFYFMIVAHESRNLFKDDRDTANKTLGRFEPPVKIELPENMAFQLMAQAMKTTADPVLRYEWENEDKPALNEELRSVRSQIISAVRKRGGIGEKAQLSDKEMQGIVPIHPYAALILKHIATVFNSNQRSMFDFIISNDMTDAKGFKWFINNYGAQSKINLLTVDLLWDFFCGKEKNGLNDDVRGILDSYSTLQSDRLIPDEQRVLKTVLILQAISMRVAGNELLSPNNENLELAFAGTDWRMGKAISVANGLVEKNLLFKKSVAGGKFEYRVLNGGGPDDGTTLAEIRKKVAAETTTPKLIVNGALHEAVDFPAAVKLRFITDGNAAGYANFTGIVRNLRQKTAPERFKVVLTFAMTDREMQQIRQQILKEVNSPDNDVIFIESLVPMGKDLYDRYIENMTLCKFNAQKDKSQAAHYEKLAMDVLKEWQDKIKYGPFMLYDAAHKGGERKATLADLQDALRDIDRAKYYYGVEHYVLNTTMYGVYQLTVGAGCGIKQELSSAYKNSNKQMSFETALAGAWKVDKYWENPAIQHLPIVHIKKKVDELVQAGFEGGAGRVSIMSILEEMEKAPYGFMPMSVTALVMGFVLKEYCTTDYFWSDGLNNETMSADKLKNMIAGALNHINNPGAKYKDEYIVAMTPAARSFLNTTAAVFGIPQPQCSSVESARDQVRVKMKDFAFPLWCVKYILKNEALGCGEAEITQVIDDYMGIANTANSGTSSENFLADEIGNTAIKHPEIVKDLSVLFTSEKCRKGMVAFIAQFRDGILPELAAEIGDGGSYLDRVKARFNAGDANWVWNVSTAEEKISDVILEYQIVLESGKTLGRYTSLRDVVNAWNARTNNIKISCDAVARHTGDLEPFLWQLHRMKRNNNIAEQDRQTFCDLLLTQRESFERFYKDQVPYFKEAAKSFLGGLEENEIAELYNSFAPGQFTTDSSVYYNYVQSEVDKYIQGQWKKKLRDLWRDKTNTLNPEDWSAGFKTPILCMFDDTERAYVKTIFDTIASPNPAEKDAKAALDYLQRADFYDRLSDEAERNECFRRRVIGRYDVLLKDIAAVREHLAEHVREKPYDWMDNSSVQNQLRTMADRQYKTKGANQARVIIDMMDANQLRAYLREKIKDDVEFGMQILKNEDNGDRQ